LDPKGGYLPVFRPITLSLLAVSLVALGGCARDYSPNTYSSNATQQANKVTQGVIVGVREVKISADGTVGTVTGAAAGGVLGGQAPGGGVTTALGAVGGTMIGGLIGSAVEHGADDTKGFEYIVKQTNGDLVSVTQKEDTPLAIGQKVLVIAGNQARIVADYSVPGETPSQAAAREEKEQKKETAKEEPAKDAGTKDAAKESGTKDETAKDIPAKDIPTGSPSTGTTTTPADAPAASASATAAAPQPAAAADPQATPPADVPAKDNTAPPSAPTVP
jgi:outer membrane lipoprotein SlyB